MEIQNKELHRVALTAIIQKDGKFLITQRSLEKKAFPGKWGVPGGGLEVDDYINTPKSASSPQWYFALTNTLKREVKEEVNLEIKNIRYLLDLTFIRPDGIPAVVLSYYCDWQSGEVKLNDENIEYKWISAEEAKNYDMIEGVAEEIEMVGKILKGENPLEVKFRDVYIMEKLFVYGTLKNPEIQKEALGKTIKGVPAVLDNYKKTEINIGRGVFPIIFPVDENEHSFVEGLVLEVSNEELKILDDYESNIYKRSKVILRNNEEAWAYIYSK